MNKQNQYISIKDNINHCPYIIIIPIIKVNE